MTRELTVELGQRSYPIRIGPGQLAHTELFETALPGRHALLLTDSHVGPLYAERVLASLPARVAVRAHTIPAGEQHKTLASAESCFAALAELRASRDACVIALGGGVIGDLGGFVAACWMRGIRFLQLPTSLLAMVDSSVGGKTAVDLPQGKNLVGAFHQPCAVIADTDVLSTLPPRELRAGLAEVVKYGAIFDAGFADWLDAQADALLAGEPEATGEAILRSCRFKAEVVARDETEQGERALLNLGHTFGHAIETEQGYGGLLHGEAVAVGMVLAARLSARLGLAPAADAERLAALLQRFGLPTALPAGLSPERLLGHMRLDKKNLSGRLRLILWRGLGQALIVPDVDEAEVLAALNA
jgi:3-dehydroquinate synthase